MSSKRLLCLLIVGIASSGEATPPCGEVATYQQILNCANGQSVQVQKAESQLKIKQASLEAAGQFKNPELTIEKFTDTDVSLQIPIEWGGQRSSRLQVASGEVSRAESDVNITKGEAYRELRLKLERLRQISEELALTEESLHTFTKLVQQYEGRPTLSSEQMVSLNVYRLAKGDYIFRKLEQEEELQELGVYFQSQFGLSLAQLKKITVPKIQKWPSVAKQSVIEKSPFLASLKSDVLVAQAELEQAQAQTWPELRLGPSLKLLGDSSASEKQQWGVNANISLPLFNWNTGGRSLAHQSLRAAELRQQLSMREMQAKRDSLVQQYQQSVTVLSAPEFAKSMEDKHQQIENLFMRGMVSSALIIEAHRSLVEFEKIRHERVLKTLNLYLTLQMMDGAPVEEGL